MQVVAKGGCDRSAIMNLWFHTHAHTHTLSHTLSHSLTHSHTLSHGVIIRTMLPQLASSEEKKTEKGSPERLNERIGIHPPGVVGHPPGVSEASQVGDPIRGLGRVGEIQKVQS